MAKNPQSIKSLLAMAQELCEPRTGAPSTPTTPTSTPTANAVREAAAELLARDADFCAQREALDAARGELHLAAARMRDAILIEQRGPAPLGPLTGTGAPALRWLPAELPIPSAPHSFVVRLAASGIILSWEARQVGTGVRYLIERRAAGSGAFRQVGITGSDCFYEDRDLASLFEGVEYRVTPGRRGRRGPCGATIRVTLGINGQAELFIRDLAETAVKPALAQAA